MRPPSPRVLAVPVVLGAVGLRRPDLLTSAAASPRTLLAVGVLLTASVLTRLAISRWRPRAAGWSGTVVLLLGIGVLLGPSLRERTVEEPFPVVAVGATAPAEAPSVRAPAPTGTPAPVATAAAAAPTPVRSAVRSATPPRPTASRLLSGRLRGVGHRARGRVSLYRVADRLVVRFESVDLQGTPGPSVHLVPSGGRSPASGVRLGRLTAEHGSFSYSLPSGTAARSWTVLVWCDPYRTPIALADLS